MNKYYDGTKLLSLKDLDGNLPEIYMVTGNRTGGKTTYFNRLAMNRFLKKGDKFCLVYRYNYELSNCSDKFFKDIRELFFPNYVMKSNPVAKGTYHELYITDMSLIDVTSDEEQEIEYQQCGYAIALNSADQIKKYSHIFNDVQLMVFDEFQSETNHYCPDEIKKLLSVHTSIARGQGKQVRYVPLYMMSNSVSLINPYFTELGISSRLNKDTKFLKGHGFVLEQCYIESAAKAQLLSGFNKAFSQNEYVAYASQNVYLNDNIAFIEKMDGYSKYLCTLICDGKSYAVREYSQEGIIYVDNKPDSTFPFKIAVTTEDHNINYVMLKKNDLFITNLRYLFDKGSCRFKDLNCKDALLKCLSY